MNSGNILIGERSLIEISELPQKLSTPYGTFVQHTFTEIDNGKEHLALTSSFDYAGPLTETVLMGNIAIRSYLLRREIDDDWDYYARTKLIWDGINMKIKNLDEANKFTRREYRSGWEI